MARQTKDDLLKTIAAQRGEINELCKWRLVLEEKIRQMESDAADLEDKLENLQAQNSVLFERANLMASLANSFHQAILLADAIRQSDEEMMEQGLMK